jgi:hypothetical protein
MIDQPGAILRLLLALALAQVGVWGLARLHRLRLGRGTMAGGCAVALLAVLPLVASHEVPAPTGVLANVIPVDVPDPSSEPHAEQSDVVFQFLPWEAEVRSALGAGHLPLWSERIDGGSSPWANPQASVLAPTSLLARLLPLAFHLLAALALKVLIAFEGTWLLARALGRTRMTSTLAGLGFALGGGIFAWGLFPHSAVAAWVPWLVLAYLRLTRHPAPRPALAAAITTVLLLVSGHPETALAGAIFAGATALALARRRVLRRGLAASLGAAALAFLLAAPLLLPFVVLARSSQRAAETLVAPEPRFDWHVLGDWLTAGEARFLQTPLGPAVFGRPYDAANRRPWDWPDALCGYAGLLAFAGAIVSLTAGPDRRRLPFLIASAGALLVAAEIKPLMALLWHVPPLRVPAYKRLLILSSLALPLAGAFGVDALRRVRLRSPLYVAFASAALLSLAFDRSLATLGLWSLLAVGFAQVRVRPRLGRALLVLAALLDLAPWAWAQLPAGDPALFYRRAPFVDQLREAAGDGRVVGGARLVYPSILSMYGLDDVRTNNPLAPRRQVALLETAFDFAPNPRRYYADFDHIEHPLVDFLAVRAVVWSVALPPPDRFEKVSEAMHGWMAIYRNPRALTRFFFPRSRTPLPDADLKGWIRDLADARDVAVASNPPPCAADPSGSPPTFERPDPATVELELEARSAPRLLVGSTLAPGWHAEANGAALPVEVVNGAYLGVCVPPETRHVTLRYRPQGFRLGLFLAAGAAACALLGWRAFAPRSG